MDNRNKKIECNNFECVLRKSKKAKRVRLTVYCDGRVVATLPQRWPVSFAEDFIESKRWWIAKKLEEFQQRGKSLLSKNDPEEFCRLREETREIVEKKLTFFNQFYNFSINKIFIRNQKTRWGSCSSNSNLSFNYKVALLPEEYQNYIVVHELCHLKEMNHSSRFWDLVAQTIPNCREMARNIRKM